MVQCKQVKFYVSSNLDYVNIKCFEIGSENGWQFLSIKIDYTKPISI